MTFSSWFTASRIKSIATLIATLASSVAVVITATRPTAAKMEDSTRGYEILRQELMLQRSEMVRIEQNLGETQAWIKIHVQHDDRHKELSWVSRRPEIVEVQAVATATTPPTEPPFKTTRSPASIQPLKPVKVPPVPVMTIGKLREIPDSNQVFQTK